MKDGSSNVATKARHSSLLNGVWRAYGQPIASAFLFPEVRMKSFCRRALRTSWHWWGHHHGAGTNIFCMDQKTAQGTSLAVLLPPTGLPSWSTTARSRRYESRGRDGCGTSLMPSSFNRSALISPSLGRRGSALCRCASAHRPPPRGLADISQSSDARRSTH